MKNVCNVPHNFRWGFTLMELMVVLIILGAITAIALPKYTQSLAAATERRAINNLYLIHSAEKTYYANYNDYWPPNGPIYDLAQINTALGLNILAGGDTYTCRFKPGPSNGYTCKALFYNSSYELSIIEAAVGNTNPCCSVGSCPITPAC